MTVREGLRSQEKADRAAGNYIVVHNGRRGCLDAVAEAGAHPASEDGAVGVEPDAARMLAGFAEMITRIQGRIARLHVALAGAAESEPEARMLFEQLEQQRLVAMKRPATLLSRRGALRRGLTTAMAADILWLHNDPVLYHQLVHKRQWTPAQFQDWLTRALQTQILR